jgi:hypothetical protein
VPVVLTTTATTSIVVLFNGVQKTAVRFHNFIIMMMMKLFVLFFKVCLQALVLPMTQVSAKRPFDAMFLFWVIDLKQSSQPLMLILFCFRSIQIEPMHHHTTMWHFRS